MNERLQELAEQAEEWNEDGGKNKYKVNLEKFAELIVQECSRIVDDWVNNEDNGKNYPSDKIKEHFGVKE